MEITFSVDEHTANLIREGYQLNSDGAVESYLSDRMIEILEKLEKTFLQCPECGKVVKRVNKSQQFCCLKCAHEHEQKTQPNLPFGAEDNDTRI